MARINIFKVERIAINEVYRLIDENFRQLPKKKDGITIDEDAEGFQHNEVDALRHAFVSGVFTMEYSEGFAKFLGDGVEVSGSLSDGNLRLQSKSRNMDYWNNHVGREYGKKSKNRRQLFNLLIEALGRGELIIDLNDPREYSSTEKPINQSVMVIKESESGENLLFFDTKKMEAFSREEFVAKIKKGEYGDDYEVRTMDGKEIPASRRDGKDNLG